MYKVFLFKYRRHLCKGSISPCNFSLILVSIEQSYQTLKTVFGHIFKHFEVRQKCSTARDIFNSLLAAKKCGQALSLVFDILI